MDFENPLGNKDPMKPEEPKSSLTPEISSAFRGGGGGGDTGRIFEARVLGEFNITQDFIDEEAALPRVGKRYKNENDIYNLVVKHYEATASPEEPPTLIGKDIRLSVAEALGLAPDEYKFLKFYTAVKTPVDYKLGVDAFIEFEDPQSGSKFRVTIDVTLNKRKIQEGGGKADIVIGELPDAIQEEEAYLKEMDEYGALIASKILREERRAA